MSFKIISARSIGARDNLLIITDVKGVKKIGSYLETSEKNLLTSLFKSEGSYAIFPRKDHLVSVLLLKDSKDKYSAREQARRTGCDLLEPLKNYNIPSVTLVNFATPNLTVDVAEGIALGNYRFFKYYKSKNNKSSALKNIRVHTSAASASEIKKLNITVSATCRARDLINEPLSYLNAVQLGKEIKSLGKLAGFKVEVFNKKKIMALKMGGLLAVNRGSFDPPTFSVLEWKPGRPKNKQPIVLVGKGVVYDTGGLSLKPTAHSMDFMKSDMGGAAIVIGSMYAAAKANLPLHIVALVPSTDNRPGNKAYVPGDVVKMHDGSTVEVLNTDAEGRMLLADALHFAKKYNPELVMDFATLTGSAARSVGPHGIAFMGNADKKIKDKFHESGFQVHERLVEFPLWAEYGEMLKSDIADLKNVGGPSAGAITAGKFLEHFTDYPWLHFDVAGSAFLHKADSYRGKNGTGVGVRLLFDFLSKY